jgi:hypothetical protein
MPLFYFSTSINGRVSRPDDPLDLPDIRNAWIQANKICGEILIEIASDFSAPDELRVDFYDGNQHLLFTQQVNSEVNSEVSNR